jgi:hypothetical protein
MLFGIVVLFVACGDKEEETAIEPSEEVEPSEEETNEPSEEEVEPSEEETNEPSEETGEPSEENEISWWEYEPEGWGAFATHYLSFLDSERETFCLLFDPSNGWTIEDISALTLNTHGEGLGLFDNLSEILEPPLGCLHLLEEEPEGRCYYNGNNIPYQFYVYGISEEDCVFQLPTGSWGGNWESLMEPSE